MTDIERDTERRITALETNMNNLIAELRDFKTELRDRDNRRAAEIMELHKQQEAAQAEIRQRQEVAQAKHDADMHEMNQRFDAIDDGFNRTMNKLNHLDEQILFATKLYWILTGVSFIGICIVVAFDMYCVFSH